MLSNIAAIIIFKAVPVLGFVLLNFLLAAQWEQDTYGRYSLVVGVLFFLGPLLSFGLPELITRKVSVYSYQNKIEKISKLYIQSISFVLLVSAIVLFVIFIVFHFFLYNDFSVILYVCPVIACGLLSSAINRGMGSLIKSQAIESIFRILVPFFLLVLWPFLGTNIIVVKSIFIVIGLIVLAIILFDVKRNVKKSFIRLYHKREYFVILRMCFPFFVISIMQGLKNFGDLFIVGYFLGANKAAIYSITLQFVVILSFAQMVISVLMSREISWALKNRHVSEINYWLKNYKRYSFLIGIFLYVFIIIIGNIIIKTYLGPKYREVILLFTILGVGRLAHLYVGPVMQLMALSNLQHKAANITVVVGVMNMLLSFILVCSFGVVGVAISGAISIALWAFILKRKVKLFLPELI